MSLVMAAAVLGAALPPTRAHAALGEPESTIASDGQQLKGSIKSTQRTNYGVHEIQLPSGTVLREFAAQGGKVFAVTWDGPVIPNLRLALGPYFDVYVTSAKANRAGRHHLEFRTDDLVMQSSGHMRAFTGRAYLMKSLPAGTSPDELR